MGRVARAVGNIPREREASADAAQQRETGLVTLTDVVSSSVSAWRTAASNLILLIRFTCIFLEACPCSVGWMITYWMIIKQWYCFPPQVSKHCKLFVVHTRLSSARHLVLTWIFNCQTFHVLTLISIPPNGLSVFCKWLLSCIIMHLFKFALHAFNAMGLLVSNLFLLNDSVHALSRFFYHVTVHFSL